MTHQIHVMPSCDLVVCIDEGRIVEQGTYASLMAQKGGYLANVMAEYGGVGDEEEDEHGKNFGRSDSSKSEKEKPAAKEEKPGGAKLMTAEERTTGSVGWKLYWEWFKFAGGVWFLGGVLFFLGATQATKVGTDVWLAGWTTDAYGLPLSTYMIVYVVLGVLQGLW